MRFTQEGEDYAERHIPKGWRYGQKQGATEDVSPAPDLRCGPVRFVADQPSISAFDRQVGGTHYSDMAIQPALYVYLNDIGAREGEAIGYLSRWRQKGGLEDLRKAIHNIELLIELEMKYGARKACRVEPEESNGV